MINIEQMVAVMTAYKEGKKIQCASKDCDDWRDIQNPCWDWYRCDYRVKPDKQLRPYANAKEFVDAMREHGIYLTPAEFDGPYMMATIVGEGTYDVWIEGDNAVSYADLLNQYKWQDGTPCGIEEGGDE